MTELKRLCREYWEKLPKYSQVFVASYPRRLEAVIAVNVLQQSTE
jgi:vesicle coat complex subunit